MQPSAQPRRVIPIRPVGGMWLFDPAQDMPNEASPDMVNFQLFNGYLRKRPGYTLYGKGTQPGSSITGIYSTHDDTDTTRLFVTTATDLYRYNPGSQNYDKMTGGPLTGNVNQPFAFETSQSSLAFCQGVDNIQVMDLTLSTYAAIGASAFPSKFLTRFNQRLYAAYTHESGLDKPRRVRWSVNGDHTNWNGVGAGFIDMADDQWFVRNIMKLMGAMVVYTEKNIWVATRTGSATNPAQFTLVVNDIGLFGIRTVKGYNAYHFFVGTDDFYQFNGVQAVPLLQNVRSLVYQELNPNSFAQCFGEINYDGQEYLAFICSGNNSWPDTVWVYNMPRNVSYPWQISLQPTSSTIHRVDNSETWTAAVGTWNVQNYTWASIKFTQNFPIILTGSVDGNVYQWSNNFLSDAGAAINCRWTSRDFTSKDIDPSVTARKITIRSVGVTILDPGTEFTLNFSYSTDGGGTWQGPYPVTMGGDSLNALGDARHAFVVTGNRIRFKIENSAVNEQPQIVALYPEFELRMDPISAN